MTDLSWKPSYETGHPRIDAEHRAFVDLVAAIAAEAHVGMSGEALRRRAVEAYKYADYHFFSEESLMLAAGYPDYARHRQLHQGLLGELKGMVEAVSLDTMQAEAMAEFLIHWFVHHAVHEDVRVARYVATSGH